MQPKFIHVTGFAFAALVVSTISVPSSIPSQASHDGANAGSLAFSFISSAQAAGKHGGGHGPEKAQSGGHGHASSGSGVGEPGMLADVKRTVDVQMTDNRFSHKRISVKKGETIRFVLHNKGEVVHEFNIGTAKMHAAHQKEMEMMVEHGVLEVDRINHGRMKMDMGGGKTMEHSDPNSKLLEPGKSAEIIWKFSADAKLEFACNVPGHYDAGMVGDISIGH